MSINPEDQQIVNACQNYLAAVNETEQWIQDNPELLSASAESLLREANGVARALRKEAITAARKMCVGVFGPSQSGKSYLISTLAQDSQGTLNAVLGKDIHDFIQEINPAGGKESTGLVTRFTLSPARAISDSSPVCLRLLSELDLVKILANTYFGDCQHTNSLNEEAVLARLTELGKKAQGASWQASFSEDDMRDLHEYINRNFRTSALVQGLENIYWPRARQIAGRLASADRAQLFEILWEQATPFTALYLRLRAVLEGLGYAEEAFCGKEALLPREKSIIDVATLQGLGENGSDTLSISASGRTMQAQRAEIAALTAELTITMHDKPDDFFEHTDLLDFPGYRSRLKTLDIAHELQKEDQLRQFFLRGKVAYLFERYKLDLELTSMLLCIGPSNQEVQDLPAVINDWVSDAHGASPELREGARNTLFLVLTKFDMEFEKKKGALDDESRWANRLHSSLLDFFGKQYEWPRLWTPQQSFTNSFWLRNPKFRWEAVIDFDQEREIGIRPEQQAYVEDMRQKFLHTPEVRAHFENPEAAWNAAMTLNDGGVAYLRTHLRPVCDPAIKRGQVSKRVRLRLTPFTEKLRRFYKTDDKEVQRAQQRKLGMDLAKTLAQTAQNQRFAELLHCLTMRDYDLYTLYYQVEARLLQNAHADDSHSRSQVSIGNAASAKGILDDLFGDELDTDAEASPASLGSITGASAPKSEEEAFAELVIDAWIERMNTVAADASRQKYFGISAEFFGHFVHELVQGMARLGLPQRMIANIRAVSQYRNMRHDKIIWRQASMAAHTVNQFVNWLGFDPSLPEHQRTVQVRGKARILFAQPMEVLDYPLLPQEPGLFDQQYYTEWLAAFLQLLEGNVDSEGTFNPVENARLARLIERLTPQN